MSINQAPLFISHGAPDLAITDNPAARFLKKIIIGKPKPAGIVIVSAHWETRGLAITTASELQTLHDFEGFGRELYTIEYPAHTSAWLIDSVASQLSESGIEIHQDPYRGLDHGAWIPLRLMLPDASVPVVQLSLDCDRSRDELFELGQSLAPLTHNNILVIGSGASVHNLWHMAPEGSPTPDWADQFERWLTKTIADCDWPGLCNFTNFDIGSIAHPTQEHLLPLIFAAGASSVAGKVVVPRQLHSGFCYGSIGMSSWEFDWSA